MGSPHDLVVLGKCSSVRSVHDGCISRCFPAVILAGYVRGHLIIMPQNEIDSASGMIDAIITVFGGSRIVAVLIGIALVFVYASYIFGWTIGGNSAALEAGEAGELPGWFAKSNKKHAPSGPAILLGIASTVLLLVYGFTANSSSDLFWTLLAFTSIIFFLPYVILSFAFLRLRKIDPDTERPFKIPGKVFPSIIAALNFVLLVIAIIGYLLPPEGEDPVTYVLILAAGLAVTQIIGEILIGIAAKKRYFSVRREISTESFC